MVMLLEVEKLSKAYEGISVVDRVSFSLEGGQTLLLLGSNGAGKTTLLSMLAGILKPDDGNLTIRGSDPYRDAQAKSAIGFVTHQSMLHPGLTLRESLVWFSQYLRVPDPKARVDKLAELLDIHDILERQAGRLSRGQSQRASIARAMVGNPALLLFDEPFSGLDRNGQHRLSEILQSLQTTERAIILTTHQTKLGLDFASHVAWIDKGKIKNLVAREDADSLLKRFEESAI